jgi:hypothetical protein
MGVAVEGIRLDEYTHKRFVFIADPDRFAAGVVRKQYSAARLIDASSV